MKRGELYRVFRGSKNDPKNYRVFLIVSRQPLIDFRFSTVICALSDTKMDEVNMALRIALAAG